MSRILAVGLTELKNQIQESITVDADNVIKLSVLKSFCENKGIKIKDLNRDVLESFNIDVSDVVDSEVLLESNNGIADEFNILRAINTNNPLLVLNELHKRGDERASRIQRQYLDFCESINTIAQEDPSISRDTDKFISNLYEVFKAAIKE